MKVQVIDYKNLLKGKMKVSLLNVAYLLLLSLSYVIFYDLYSTQTANSWETKDGDIIIPGDQSFWEPWEMTEPPCSLRKAVRKDSLLEKSFRFSQPVFQWAETFSNHTWEQLKTLRPPYGWKGLPVDDVRLALSLVNSSGLFDRSSPGRCIRCAVVGNGGILRGSKQGKNIDNHDFVFRVNGAVTEGFEEDVGMKTSFYVFTMNTMKNALKMYKKDGFTETPYSPDMRYIFIATCIRDYVMIAAAIQNRTVPSGYDKGDRPTKYFGHKSPESFKILHPEFISYVTHRFLNSYRLTHPRLGSVYRPSTGALMLLTALHSCDQVSAYGFITQNFAEFSDHYYDSVKKPLILYGNHDLGMESKLWEDLHLKRVMNLYQRTADSSPKR